MSILASTSCSCSFLFLFIAIALLPSPLPAAAGVIRPFNFSGDIPSSSAASSLHPTSDSDVNERKLILVSTPSPSLKYYGGPLLTGRSVRLHILWYGSFSADQQSAIADFVSSFSAGPRASPSVRSWWRVARRYSDGSKAGAAAAFRLRATASDPTCRLMGKSLKESDLSTLVTKAIAARYLPRPPRSGAPAIYVVFTAADVLVEDFCMNSCGTHSSATIAGGGAKVPFVWVGNPATQCPGLCAWPYAVPQYGPPEPALSPPNGEAATDGMIVNLALLLAGTVTNPFDTGYFQGDSAVPLEAGSACQGIYGSGSYPGYPGQLLQEKESGASYNAVGANNRRFLLPALWNPATGTCVAPI